MMRMLRLIRNKYVATLIVVVLIALVVAFMNIGKYLDIGEEPIESDIIVCLGGGEVDRIQMASNLYLRDYSKKDILLLTGDDRSAINKKRGERDNRINYFISRNLNINYIHYNKTKSTKEELEYVRDYMKLSNFTSVLIVSDPPHLRRIRMLSEKILQRNGIKYCITGGEPRWWNRDNYYSNPRAIIYTVREMVKIPYNMLLLSIEKDN